MAGPEDITLFSSVDRTKEPDFFKRFLDEGNKLPGIIASKPIILAGLQLTGGEKVLDAGCGLGDDTFEIAQIVGSRVEWPRSCAACVRFEFWRHRQSEADARRGRVVRPKLNAISLDPCLSHYQANRTDVSGTKRKKCLAANRRLMSEASARPTRNVNLTPH